MFSMAGEPTPSLYEAIGGMAVCRELSIAFYGRVAHDPVLSPFFSPSFRCAIDALTAFVAQLLGGPCEYSEMRWWLSLRESHLRFKIGRKERDAWMENMLKALDDVKIAEPLHSSLKWFFEHASADLVNDGTEST